MFEIYFRFIFYIFLLTTITKISLKSFKIRGPIPMFFSYRLRTGPATTRCYMELSKMTKQKLAKVDPLRNWLMQWSLGLRRGRSLILQLVEKMSRPSDEKLTIMSDACYCCMNKYVVSLLLLWSSIYIYHSGSVLRTIT